MDSKEVFIQTTNISDKIKTEKIKEKLENQKERRRLAEKLKNVPGLADSDEEEDAAEWYQRTKRIRSDRHEESLKEKSSQEVKPRSNKNYTSSDLKGLAIGHKADSFKEGQQIVLTLRDKDVLDEDEDVLENVNIIDDERATKNIENKNKRPEYRPYDDEEFDEFGIIKKPALLNKYDEEIEGPKKEMFRIGSSNQKPNNNLQAQESSSSTKISLNWPDLKIANEYYTPDEMLKFKKPSKKKGQFRKKGSIKSEIKSENLESETLNQQVVTIENEVVEEPKPKKFRTLNKDGKTRVLKLDIEKLDDNLIGPDEDLSGVRIDDEAQDELQSVLHKTRKIKLKEKSVDPALTITKLIQNVKKEKPIEDNDDDDSNQEKIVLNATAEFCRNLGEASSNLLNVRSRKETVDIISDIEIKDDVDNIVNDDGDDENSNDDSKYRNNWNEVDVKMEELDEGSNDEQPFVQSQPILEEEPDISVGVAGALKLAMTKGYLDKESTKSFGATRASSVIQAKSYTIEEKFYEDDRMGRRDRYSGPLSEFREKDNYKPDFKLDYVDEKGRMMNQKEAFRYLSHKFHGKGPGKNKIDKRMKKMEQESKLRQMSSTDTPLNTVKLLQEKQKELQTPYIVLSGPRNSSNNITQISKSKMK